MCCAGSLLRCSFSKLFQNAFVGAIWWGFIMYCKGFEIPWQSRRDDARRSNASALSE